MSKQINLVQRVAKFENIRSLKKLFFHSLRIRIFTNQ